MISENYESHIQTFYRIEHYIFYCISVDIIMFPKYYMFIYVYTCIFCK